VTTLRRDLLKVSEACGVPHPALVGPSSIEILENLSDGRLLDQVYGYQPGWGLPAERDREELVRLMSEHDEPEVPTEGPAGDRVRRRPGGRGRGLGRRDSEPHGD
jgi:glutamate synthase (ferredoxin)